VTYDDRNGGPRLVIADQLARDQIGDLAAKREFDKREVGELEKQVSQIFKGETDWQKAIDKRLDGMAQQMWDMKKSDTDLHESLQSLRSNTMSQLESHGQQLRELKWWVTRHKIIPVALFVLVAVASFLAGIGINAHH
jgi:hypothetical protein